jgi:hypothetical protein
MPGVAVAADSAAAEDFMAAARCALVASAVVREVMRDADTGAERATPERGATPAAAMEFAGPAIMAGVIIAEWEWE